MVSEKAANIIDTKIRPVLRLHGGDIQLLEVTADGWVRVKLTGACSTCPGIHQTLTKVVEKALCKEYPELRGVIPITQVSDELIQEALLILRKPKSEKEGAC
jgi:Fe-S cluster biogenesis protein NfuA